MMSPYVEREDLAAADLIIDDFTVLARQGRL